MIRDYSKDETGVKTEDHVETSHCAEDTNSNVDCSVVAYVIKHKLIELDECVDQSISDAVQRSDIDGI